jgi:hypothetical protein
MSDVMVETMAASAASILCEPVRDRRVGLFGAALTAGLLLASTGAWADKIRNTSAVFSGLDKITGRIVSFEVKIDETVQFGTLQLTTRACYTRPATEAPQTDAFIEVDEVGLDKETRRIFGGWVFAASPGLHGIEHPVYDLWLTACKGGTAVVAEEPAAKPAAPAASAAPAPRITNQRPPAASGGQLGTAPPAGVPVAPRTPTQRFYPPAPVDSAPLGAPRPPGSIPVQ